VELVLALLALYASAVERLAGRDLQVAVSEMRVLPEQFAVEQGQTQPEGTVSFIQRCRNWILRRTRVINKCQRCGNLILKGLRECQSR